MAPTNPWNDVENVRAGGPKALAETFDLTSVEHMKMWLALEPTERMVLLSDESVAAKIHEAAVYARRLSEDVGLLLFDDLVASEYAPCVGDALWSATPGHTQWPLDEARCRRYLVMAEQHADNVGQLWWWIARIYMHLGEIDVCIEALRKAKARGDDMREPRDADVFRGLWSNAEFAALFADMGPAVWKVAFDEPLPPAEQVPFVRELELHRPGAIPEALRTYVNLERLAFYGEASTLPAWLPELTKLRSFTSVPFEMTEVSHAVLSMPSLRECELYGMLPKGYERSAIKQLVASFHKDEVSAEDRSSYLNILVGHGKKSSDAQLVDALGSSATKLSREALRVLEARWKSRSFALKEGAELVFSGRIAERSVVKERLERVGVAIKRKVSDKTVAVILGAKHAGKVDAGDAPLFLESHLHAALDVVDKRPLTPSGETSGDEGASETSALSELLMSTDESNVRIGVEMIKQGGKPAGLLEELLLIAQYPEFERKVRNSAKTLFERHAGADAVAAVRKHLARTSFFNSGETKLAKRVAAIGKGSAGTIDAKRLGALMFQRSGHGLKYLLKVTKESPARRALLERRCSGNELDLAELELPAIPDEVAEFQSVRTLGANANHITELSGGLFELAELEVLHLFENRLRGIPDGIAAMTGLRTLTLGSNYFSYFPAALGELSGLTYLDLSMDWQPATLMPYLSEAVGGLVSLERLALNNHVLKELPPELADLPALKSLELRSGKLEHVPAWLTDMPALDELNVAYMKAGNEAEAEAIYAALVAKGVTVTR